MSIVSTATIYNRHDGSTETLPADQAALKTYYQRETWSAQPLPPKDWEREVPRYRITRDLAPAMKNRFRFENPYTDLTCGDSWQYGEKSHQVGAEIESKCWPHPSMRPMNYGAERVMAFFNSAMRSRLTTSPWHGDRVRLDDGLSGTLPKLQTMTSRPAA
jgi:hypothetical protein